MTDWVVIYFHKDQWPEGQRTIVTERSGMHRGSRVVRGREAECFPGPAEAQTEAIGSVGADRHPSLAS